MLGRGLRAFSDTPLKMISGAAIALLVSGAVVWADGGDDSLVHACVFPDVPENPNVRIIDPDEACPAGAEPVHWSATAPPTPAPTDVPPLDGGTSNPTKKVASRLYKPLGVKPGKTKIVTGTTGPDPAAKVRTLTVSCPGSFPFALQGQAQGISAEPGVDFSWPTVHPVGFHAWSGYMSGYKTVGDVIKAHVGARWTLKVSVECAKVVKPKGGNVKLAG